MMNYRSVYNKQWFIGKFWYLLGVIGVLSLIHSTGLIDRMYNTSVVFIGLPFALILTLGQLNSMEFTMPVWMSRYLFRISTGIAFSSLFVGYLMALKYWNFS